jgi:hypothetical protein
VRNETKVVSVKGTHYACDEGRNIESFNGKLRDELLNREIFTTLTEAKVLIEE